MVKIGVAMIICQDSIKPIYIQIAEGIEDDILNGLLAEDEQVYSQYLIAKQYNINPATAAKGITLLYTEGIIYKKRGLGMYVAAGAKKMVLEKRKKKFYDTVLKEFLHEAQKLNIDKEELKMMIDRNKGDTEDELSD
jgi:GntR family transcriptional regulator